jgi:hypothetical protein
MYSGVTLGLVHGAAPHAFVLCHRAGTTEIEGCPGHPIPSLPELVERHQRVALPRRPARVACVALNTAHLAEDGARAAEATAETGLPADDPVGSAGSCWRRLGATLGSCAWGRVSRSTMRLSSAASAILLQRSSLASAAPAADVGANDDSEVRPDAASRCTRDAGAA